MNGARRLFTVAALDVGEGAGADVGQVQAELDFARDVGRDAALVVPGVAVPAVEVLADRQRSPPLGLDQGVRVAEVGVERLLSFLHAFH